MSISKFISKALAAAALAPMLFLTDCSCENQDQIRRDLGNKVGRSNMAVAIGDSPSQSHSLGELSARWVWETIEGDAASNFGISIEQISENEIRIVNFLNLDGESITANVDNGKLSFSGEMAGGNLMITNGTGNITNGWINIQLEYDTYDGDISEHHRVMLSKGSEL